MLHLLANGYEVTALGFDYGQKHKVELERATSLVEYLNGCSQKAEQDQLGTITVTGENFPLVNFQIIKLDGLSKLLNSALVTGGSDVPEGHYEQDNMKETVVPNRNKILKYLFTDDEREKIKSKIFAIMRYYVEINTITTLKKNKYWNTPNYSNSITKIWGIRNPLLSDNQIENPVNLKKNIIITGVNAGGKTTYVKSIASNIILAQTFGIINGIKADITLFDAVISFMRVKDEVGFKSYFEAETDCCNKIIEIADEISKLNKRGLFILDEPMHSTPPIEGMSVAYAISKYLGNLKGIRIIITTHFHNLISLEEYKDRFINLSVNANKINNNFKFDYKINKGSSKQTIAIELLKKQKFNDEIINSAIEIKNKLCNDNLRYDN